MPSFIIEPWYFYTVIRLVATDMDGTFLCGNRKLIQQNIESVQKLTDSGVLFCLASGRGISTITPFWKELGMTGPTVSSNGAYVIDQHGAVVVDNSLPLDVVKSLLEYATEHSVHVNVYSGDQIYFSQKGDFGDLYRTRTGCNPIYVDSHLLHEKAATKLLFVDHPEGIIKHTAATRRILEKFNISVVISEPDYLEFLPDGINKGIGLARLADHLGFESHEVAAIGDWTNDLEMLQWVGLSGCVANAAPEIKEIAAQVYSSNEEFGFSEFAETILKHNSEGILIS